jgi:hypothetical protein
MTTDPERGFQVVAVPVASMPPPPPPPPVTIVAPIRGEIEPVRAWRHRPGDGPRADGTLPNAPPGEPRFGRAWTDASLERRQVLESDPFYRLAREVAGRTGRHLEDMLDMKNITDRAAASPSTTPTLLENATLESIDAFRWFSLSDAIDGWARGSAVRDDLQKDLLAAMGIVDALQKEEIVQAKQELRDALLRRYRRDVFTGSEYDFMEQVTWSDAAGPTGPEWEATKRELGALRRQERAAWHETATTPLRLASAATVARLQANAQTVGELDFILDGDTANYAALRKALPAAAAQPSMDQRRLRELLDQRVERERQRLVDEARAAAEGPPALRWIPLPAQLGVLFLREQLQAALTAALDTILNRLGKAARLWRADASQREIATELIDEPQVASNFFELVAAHVRLADVLYPTRNQSNKAVIANARTALVILVARFERLGRDVANRLALLGSIDGSSSSSSLPIPLFKRPRLNDTDQRRYGALSGAERREFDTARELASL